ncbi:hypothetical protein [Frankia sp. AiPs1]|nr:hypothetical protein [Frankia sp. AiPs1]
MTDRPDYQQLRPAQHLREEILTICASTVDASGRTGDTAAR